MKRLLSLLLTVLCLFFLSQCGSTSSKTKYQVSISVTPSNAGSVSPSSGQYKEGTELHLEATPADNTWKFDHWSGDYTRTSSTGTVTVTNDMHIVGHFSKKQYKLTVHNDGKGEVEQKIIENNTSTAKNYDAGTTVQLTAKPDKGWKFVKWEGDLEGSKNPAVITLKEPKEVTAVFKKKSFKLTVKTDGNGTVTKKPDLKKYKYGTEVTLTAKPDQGWKFVKWEGNISSTKQTINITMDKAKTVTAIFEKEKYTLSVSSSGDGSVSVIPDNKYYDYNTEVKLLAIANKGSSFIRWKGALSKTETKGGTLFMTQDYSVKAIFKTYKEALISNFYPSIIIGSRVNEATLSLTNTLPAQIQLKKIIVKRGDGSISAQQKLTAELIPSDKSISFSLSFGVTPTLNSFNKYTVTWICEYYEVDHDIVVTDGVTTSSNRTSEKKHPLKVIKTIKLHADGQNK